MSILNYHMAYSSQYITVDKDILGGTPVFKSTRVAIKIFFDYLEHKSLQEFLEEFPAVSREQAEFVIEQAANKFLSELEDGIADIPEWQKEAVRETLAHAKENPNSLESWEQLKKKYSRTN